MSRRSPLRPGKKALHPTNAETAPHFFRHLLVWLYHLLLITTPLFFAFTTDELFEFNKMMLVYVYTVLIVAVWIGRMIFEKRWIWRRTPFDLLIGIFLLTQLLSTIFSIDPYTSLFGYYSRFHGGLASLVSYALIYWAFVSNLVRKDLRPLALSAMTTGAIVSLYAIGEHFGHSFSCYLNSGGTSFNASCWVQDVQHRVFATFGQPNWLAAYTLMLLSCVMGLLLSQWPKRGERLWYFICSLLLFWTLLYTRSRSGFLGFVTAFFIISAGLAIRWWLQRHMTSEPHIGQHSWKQYLVMLVTLIIAAGLSGTPYSPSIGELFSQQKTIRVATDSAPVAAVNRLDIGGTDSGEIRKIVWQGAINVWKRYPIFGSGVETFAYSYYQDRPPAHNLVSEWDFLYNKAHNELLNFLATTGAVGLSAYLLLLSGYLIISLRGFVQLSKAHHDDRANILLGLAGAVAGLTVSNFFGFSTVVVTVLQYLAMGTTMLLLLEPVNQPKPVKEVALWQMMVLILVVIASLFPLKSIVDRYRADQLYTQGKALAAQGEFQKAGLKLSNAIQLNPREALFWDEIGQLYAQAAVSYVPTEVPRETINQLAHEAVTASDKALQLNSRQLNFYKTRARMFIILSQIDATYLSDAVASLETAVLLSPTDPKLVYNLGMLQFQLGNTASALNLLEKVSDLKPNYTTAIMELAGQEWLSGKKQSALDRLLALRQYDPNSAALNEAIASYSAQLNNAKE